MNSGREPGWDEWFSVQYDLLKDLKENFREATDGKSAEFKTAVLSSLIEGLSEEMRLHLELRATDTKVVPSPEPSPQSSAADPVPPS